MEVHLPPAVVDAACVREFKPEVAGVAEGPAIRTGVAADATIGGNTDTALSSTKKLVACRHGAANVEPGIEFGKAVVRPRGWRYKPGEPNLRETGGRRRPVSQSKVVCPVAIDVPEI